MRQMAPTTAPPGLGIGTARRVSSAGGAPRRRARAAAALRRHLDEQRRAGVDRLHAPVPHGRPLLLGDRLARDADPRAIRRGGQHCTATQAVDEGQALGQRVEGCLQLVAQAGQLEHLAHAIEIERDHRQPPRHAAVATRPRRGRLRRGLEQRGQERAAAQRPEHHRVEIEPRHLRVEPALADADQRRPHAQVLVAQPAVKAIERGNAERHQDQIRAARGQRVPRLVGAVDHGALDPLGEQQAGQLAGGLLVRLEDQREAGEAHRRGRDRLGRGAPAAGRFLAGPTRARRRARAFTVDVHPPLPPGTAAPATRGLARPLARLNCT